MKSVSISLSIQISRLQPENSVWCLISVSVCWKWWWQCWSVTKFVPRESHKCSHRQRRIERTLYSKFVRIYWTNMELKVTVSGDFWWLKIGVLGMVTWIPYRRKTSRNSSKQVMCTVFWDRKGVVHLDFLEPSYTINSEHYIAMLSWRLELSESGQRRRQSLLQQDNTRPHTNWETMNHIANLVQTVLPQLLYSLDLVTSDFHLFGLMKNCLYGKHFPINDPITAAVKQ